jgi:transcriptional regulator with XRE-family HTH domain
MTDSTPRKTFGAWLRGLRAEKQQTQDEASTALGVSTDLLASWENERRIPVKVSHVLRAAAWAGADRGDVFELVAADLEDRVSAAV